MNKYRLVFQYDDFDEYACLKCKKSFVHTESFNYVKIPIYTYCPHCGTKWDGFFSKQHKKYYLKQPHMELYPRLIVEMGDIVDRYMWFTYIDIIFCPRYWNGNKSITNTIVDSYNQACKKYDKVRLLYMVSPFKKFIVKEKNND